MSSGKRCDACGLVNSVEAPQCPRCGASVFSIGGPAPMAPPQSYPPALASYPPPQSYPLAPAPPVGPSPTAQLGMVRCPVCGSVGPPYYKSKVSTAGWIVFVLLLVLFCWPLCWIGLLMKENYAVCSTCWIKLER
jgi:hypothetical protein